MLLFEGIFVDLFSVYHFVCNVFLCVLYIFWSKKEADNVGVIGIRDDKSCRDDVFTSGNYF